MAPGRGLGGLRGTPDGIALACNPYSTTTECLQVFDKAQAEAAQAGCTTQWNAAIDCTDSHPDTRNSGQVVADPSCKTAFESYLA